MINVAPIPFDTISYYWQFLWPNRQTPIKTHSSLTYDKNIDMSIYNNTPTFVGAFLDSGTLIGVNSGFRTSPNWYRSRGLWVNPHYRRMGASQLLLQAVQNQALKEDCTHIWTIPRKSSLGAYTRFGFVRTSDWFEENMEFGPNCLALKVL
jgi:GNAT superfamily N-acetyltransferase